MTGQAQAEPQRHEQYEKTGQHLLGVNPESAAAESRHAEVLPCDGSGEIEHLRLVGDFGASFQQYFRTACVSDDEGVREGRRIFPVHFHDKERTRQCCGCAHHRVNFQGSLSEIVCNEKPVAGF